MRVTGSKDPRANYRQRYNPWGSKLEELYLSRGINRRQLANRIKDAGWPLEDPYSTIEKAMGWEHPKAAYPTLVYFITQILDLDEAELIEFWAAYAHWGFVAVELGLIGQKHNGRDEPWAGPV